MSDDLRPSGSAAGPGKPHDVEGLLERHLSGLRAFVRLNAGPALRAREAQSDLVQSVCREVLEGLDQFEYRGDAAFKLWLFQTARRKIIDRARYWRRDKRALAREVALDPSPRRNQSSGHNLLHQYATFCTPSQEAILHEEQARIEQAFAKLSPEHRKVITLARIVGLSHREIGERMRRNEAAARQLLHRALAQLSKHLESGSPDDDAPRVRVGNDARSAKRGE
jgi:RNA polymerase sigma-70 factor (subfamily 1)